MLCLREEIQLCEKIKTAECSHYGIFLRWRKHLNSVFLLFVQLIIRIKKILTISHTALPLSDGEIVLKLIFQLICTRGQFWPSGIVVACVCVCVRLSVCVYVSVSINHELVRTITQQPCKLGSPNLDHRCKRASLRSLLFLGVNDRDL